MVPFQFDADPSTTAKGTLEAPRRSRKPAAIPSATIPIPQPKQHVSGKRGGSATQLSTSPPKKESERAQGRHKKSASPPASSGVSPPAGAKGRKHHRDPSTKSLPSLAATASVPGLQQSGRASPPRKRAETAPQPTSKPAVSGRRKGDSARELHGGITPAEPALAQQQAALAHSTSASRFAGPAFTNSPTPDSLPLPTSSLLLAQAAEHLGARLQL